MGMSLLKQNYRKIFFSFLILCCAVLITIPVLADNSLPVVTFPVSRNTLAAGSDRTDHSLAFKDQTFYFYLPLNYQDHFGQAVNPLSRQDSLAFFLEQYLASEGIPVNWTGSHGGCDPGSTSQNFKFAIQRRINYFRAMAGVPAKITFSESANQKAQSAALMISVNRQVSHFPPSSWLCYTAPGAEAAGMSNLILGIYSWDAITFYMRDYGSKNYFVGHRRWLLYPQTQEMGTGDIPPVPTYSPSNALVAWDTHVWDSRPPTREQFVAWPPPGYVPYQVVFPRWSFSYAGADFSGAAVSMVSGGNNLPVSLQTVVDGFGENTLVWVPMGLKDEDTWPQPGTDTRYTITIHNVLINQQSRDFTYDVIIFNPTP